MVDSVDYHKWMNRAAQDLRTIENNFKDDPEFLASVNCYLAQQAAEKLLKAFLLSHEIHLPKTHDLMFLFKSCIDIQAEFQPIKEPLEILNLYAIEARYPGDFFDQITAVQGQEAYEAVSRVRELVEGMLLGTS